MAKIDSIAKFILSFEGGFVNDPVDRGGATNKGVTIATWRMQGYDKDGDGDIDVDDLKLISDADAIEVMRRCFWKRWRADEIKNQNLANILVDWIWCSGTPSITITQAMLVVFVSIHSKNSSKETQSNHFHAQLQACFQMDVLDAK